MRKVLYVCAILFIMIGCASRKLGDRNPPIAELPSTIHFSANYRLFWMDLVKISQNRPINRIKPNKQMINNYNIQKIKGYYVISGFIFVGENFDKQVLKDLGVELHEFSLSINNGTAAFSFRAPISVMPKVYKIKGILSIELSQRVFLK